MPTYTATELTLEQRSALVDKLCSTPEVVLKKLKKDELIALAAGIVSYYKKLTKLELLDELLKIRTSELVQKEAIAIAARASEEERKARLEDLQSANLGWVTRRNKKKTIKIARILDGIHKESWLDCR